MYWGMLGSRPYRLLAQVEADFCRLNRHSTLVMLKQRFRPVVEFSGKDRKPILCAWRDCLESRLSEAIFQSNQSDVLLKHIAHVPEAIDAIERLADLLPAGHPAHQLVLKYREIQQ